MPKIGGLCLKKNVDSELKIIIYFQLDKPWKRKLFSSLFLAKIARSEIFRFSGHSKRTVSARGTLAYVGGRRGLSFF